MPLFRYQAISEKGKKIQGTIDADNVQEAKIKLIRRQIAAIQIEPLSQKQIQVALSRTERLHLTREIARLLQAGLPLFEALSALEEKYRGQKSHALFLDLCDQVRNGTPFSKALASHPKTFDLLYISMIANAETSGRLVESLLEIAELLTRQIQVRKQLLAALLYPALLSGFCLVVLSSLLFFVIPSLQELFEGRNLHPFTRVVFAASHFACQAKGTLLLLLIACGGALCAASILPSWKQKGLSWLYRAPFLKHLFAKVAFVRFSRAASTLIDGGLPLIQAFAHARKVLNHPPLEQLIQQAEERISQGESLQTTFQNHSLIPPLIPRMLGIAEEGGKVPFMMRQIAEIYEEELDRNLQQFSTLAQPILLLVLGGIIGFILLSVLLPLTDVSSFAAG